MAKIWPKSTFFILVCPSIRTMWEKHTSTKGEFFEKIYNLYNMNNRKISAVLIYENNSIHFFAEINIKIRKFQILASLFMLATMKLLTLKISYYIRENIVNEGNISNALYCIFCEKFFKKKLLKTLEIFKNRYLRGFWM